MVEDSLTLSCVLAAGCMSLMKIILNILGHLELPEVSEGRACPVKSNRIRDPYVMVHRSLRPNVGHCVGLL